MRTVAHLLLLTLSTVTALKWQGYVSRNLVGDLPTYIEKPPVWGGVQLVEFIYKEPTGPSFKVRALLGVASDRFGFGLGQAAQVEFAGGNIFAVSPLK